MNFDTWEKDMLAKGYQKFFLGDIAKDSVSSFKESLQNLNGLADSSTAALLEETTELKGIARKFCVSPMLKPIEDFEQNLQDSNHDACLKLVKELVLLVKDYNKMLIEHCA